MNAALKCTPVRRGVLAVGLAGALAVSSVVPSFAAGVPAATAAVRQAVSGDMIDVHWRGRYGGAVIGGLAAGLALGAIAASRPHYYDPGPAYDGYAEPYYAPPPAYEEPEVYVAPPAPRGGPMRQCWVQTDDRGFGHWRPC